MVKREIIFNLICCYFSLADPVYSPGPEFAIVSLWGWRLVHVSKTVQVDYRATASPNIEHLGFKELEKRSSCPKTFGSTELFLFMFALE